MGVVYKAEDTRLNRVVALKFLPPEMTRDAAAKARFLVEARAASAIDHPAVCPVHEIDETPDGGLFICMAYCEGETLRERLARAGLPVDQALVIAIQVAEGLQAAHDHGIVHRDVKPGNISLAHDGTARLLDFGVAMLTGKPVDGEAGFVIGTAGYMSPEQAAGRPVDQRSDIWSLGVVLYEMLTGRLPFSASGPGGLPHAILHTAITPPATLRPEVPPELDWAVGHCLEKTPERRFRTADELCAALRRVRQRMLAPPTTVVGPEVAIPAPAGRRRLLFATGLGLAVATSLLVLVPALREGFGASALPDQRHVAVLEFTNIGGDTANRTFCEGITEVAASTLSELEPYQGALSVVPVAEVRKMEVHSPSEARQAFGINLVIAGSVQRQDDRVLIALNLIDASTLRQKRSRVINARVDDLAGAGDRVVDALVSMLDVELAEPGRSQIVAGGTREPKAWDLYVQALGVLRGTQGPGEPGRAALLFKKAIALDPSFVRAHAGLAEAYLDTYRRDKDARWVEQAVASIERAAALDSRVTAVHLIRGKINAATGNYEEAVHDFRRVLDVEPRNSDAFGGLGRALESLGRDREAEASYQRAIELKPAHWLAYTALGNFYFREARYDEAVRQHRRVIALTPENSWGYNNLGAVYFGLGRSDEARAMFERSAAIKPNYAAFSNLGSLHFQAGAFAEAAPFFAKALAINPQDYSLWGNMATCYHFVPGRQDQARAAYRRAVELAEKERQVDERDPNLLVDLAGYHGMLGERTEGLALLEQVLKAPPTSAELMCAVGQSFEDLGERKRALEWIGKALSAGYPRAGIEGSPALQNLTRDPRYRGLVRAIGRRT